MKRDDLVAWLDRELDLSAYRSDHSNNGLQVEGAQEVTRALFAVDGCLATFRLAAERGADSRRRRPGCRTPPRRP